MSKRHLLSVLFFVFSGAGLLKADAVLYTLSGQFSSTGVTKDSLAAPGGSWTMSFEVSIPPQTSNVTSTGFDAAFSLFNYTLNGSAVNASPQSIRMFTSGGIQNGGFTAFFGPESGFSNGAPIPELEVLGPQLFTGSTSSPTLSTGSITGTEWVYSDASNFDDHVTSTVIRASAVPEPSSLMLFALPLGLILFGALGRRSV